MSDRAHRSDGSRPRVCAIVSSFHPVIGGIQNVTRTLYRALRERGGAVRVLTRRGRGLSGRERVDGIPVRRAGLPTGGKLGSLTFVAHGTLLLLTELRRSAVLHIHDVYAPLWIAAFARVLLRRRVVMTVHGEVLARRRGSWRGRLRLRLMRATVDRFIALSTHMRDQLIAEGVPPERVRWIPNAVDTARFRPADAGERGRVRRRLGLPERGRIALFAGRLHPVKGVATLIDAWRRVDGRGDRLLLIVGDGPERARLEAAAAGADSIRFAGVSREVASYLRAADAFILPSIEEGVSVALLEAMAAAVPVLVSDVPGNRAVVRDGANGILFAPSSADDLAHHLERLLGDPSLAGRLGRSGRETILRRYGLADVVSAVEAVYRDLTSGGRSDHRSVPQEIGGRA